MKIKFDTKTIEVSKTFANKASNFTPSESGKNSSGYA